MTKHTTPRLAVHWNDAKRFIETIAGEPNPLMCWQTFDDKGINYKAARMRNGRLSEREFRRWLLARQAEGCGIYVCVNETDGEGRRRENIVSARAAWVDMDGVPLPETWPIEPDVIEETSPGRYQAFWALDPEEDLNVVSDLQARLAAYFGGDPSVTDPPRVCRVPGFFHLKREPFRSRIITAVEPEERARDAFSRHIAEELAKLHPCDYSAPKPCGSGGRLAEPAGGFDKPADIRRAREYLQDAPPSIEGEAGNKNAYKVACRLNDLGISPARTLELMTEDGGWNTRCEPPWSTQELEAIIDNASAYKQDPPGSASPQTDFEPVSEEELDDADLERALSAYPKPPMLSEVNASNINDAFAMVSVSGKARVFYWGPSSIDSRVRVPEFWLVSDFRHLLSNKRVKVGEGEDAKTVPLADHWLGDRGRKTFDGLMFDAAREDPQMINLWHGFSVEPEPGNWRMMERHITDIIAAGDAKSGEYILKWIAWAYQNPTLPAEVVLALTSKERGTGKGALAREVALTFGAHGLHISSRKHLVGNFNAHFAQCGFLFADEVLWPGDKEAEGRFKALVTEPTLTIEPKGINAFTVNNALKIIMSSNEDWFFPAARDERRAAVFEVSAARKQDHDYFGALTRSMRKGGRAAMLHDLLRMDLRGWHPRNDIPQTAALAKQKRESAEPEVQWLASMLDRGVLPYQHMRRWNECQAGMLYRHARQTARLLDKWTDNKFADFLDKWGVTQKRANGSWRVFPPLQAMRARFLKERPWWGGFDSSVREWGQGGDYDV